MHVGAHVAPGGLAGSARPQARLAPPSPTRGLWHRGSVTGQPPMSPSPTSEWGFGFGFWWRCVQPGDCPQCFPGGQLRPRGSALAFRGAAGVPAEPPEEQEVDVSLGNALCVDRTRSAAAPLGPRSTGLGAAPHLLLGSCGPGVRPEAQGPGVPWPSALSPIEETGPWEVCV